MSTPLQPISSGICPIPIRRLEPDVHIDDEDERAPGRDLRRLRVYFSCLSDSQATLLTEVLAELPSAMQSVKTEAWENTKHAISRAFRLSESTIKNYNAEAWAHELWHESYLHQTPCLSLADAIERCAKTPWNVFDDLLVLPHRGSRYVPLFLFNASGPPDPWWIAVLGALRQKDWVDPWKLLAWLMTPQVLLQRRTPIDALPDNPKRVISLAKLATHQDEV